jgi:hypothetical protein
MTGLLLCLPWAHHALPAPTPPWVHGVSALGAVMLAGWTAWMGVREARKRARRVVRFPGGMTQNPLQRGGGP